MKFTKKRFKSEYKKKKEVDELHNLGDEHSDRPNLSSVSQITTNSLKSKVDDFSDFEEDPSTYTDELIPKAMNTFIKQNSWFSNMGSPYIREDNLEESSEEKMKRLVRELLQQRTSDNEIVNKGNDFDINNNKIVDIDELGNPDISIATTNLIEAIKSSNLTDEQLNIVFNHIKTEINK